MPILEKDISDAVSAWGDGLLEISNAYENSGIEKATLVAEGMLEQVWSQHLFLRVEMVQPKPPSGQVLYPCSNPVVQHR